MRKQAREGRSSLGAKGRTETGPRCSQAWSAPRERNFSWRAGSGWGHLSPPPPARPVGLRPVGAPYLDTTRSGCRQSNLPGSPQLGPHSVLVGGSEGRGVGRGAEALGFGTGALTSGRAKLHTWLLGLTLLPHAARAVVRSVLLHTMLTELQLFAGPSDSWPDVHSEQGSPPKASSSFTWEWDGSYSLNPSCSPPSSLPYLSLSAHKHSPGSLNPHGTPGASPNTQHTPRTP